MRRRDLFAAAGLLAGLSTRARADQTIPEGYGLVWSDEFKSFSPRRNGVGTWACPGIWYSKDPRGVVGYSGWDWFVNPLYGLWPQDYHGQVVHTAEGLRIRAEAPSPRMAALLPKVKGRTPWLCGQVNSFYAVRISPPFYFEASAKMPAGTGQPWPGIWVVGDAHHHAYLGPEGTPGKEYEIDVHEGFGDSDYLHSTIHWHTSPYNTDYPHQGVVYTQVNDLSTDFNVWGCHVTTERQVFYFNGKEVGRMDSPKDALVDQPYGINLTTTAGIPWKGGGPPSDGPHDMIVRYVRFYAPDKSRLDERGIVTRSA